MTSQLSVHAVALWVGLHLFLLLILSALVVRQRSRHKIALGDEGISELAQAIRAFGNATEYIPAGLVGLVMLGMVEASPILIHLCGLLLLVGRSVHAFGLSSTAGTSIARTVGTLATWVAYLVLGVVLLVYAIA